MKKIILIASMLLVGFSASAEKQYVIANPGDFIILSNVENPEIRLFLSYAGNGVNKCGILLRTHSLSRIGGEDLHKVLAIDTYDANDAGVVDVVGAWRKELLARIMQPEIMSFGEFFKVRSRGGKSIKNAIASLGKSTVEPAEVIVEALPCN